MDRNEAVIETASLFRVALRKESVDRNRRCNIGDNFLTVALRKESVDRNQVTVRPTPAVAPRSPQGERG